MPYHQLLEKQITKWQICHNMQTEAILGFLTEVDNAYKNFDHNKEMAVTS